MLAPKGDVGSNPSSKLDHRLERRVPGPILRREVGHRTRIIIRALGESPRHLSHGTLWQEFLSNGTGPRLPRTNVSFRSTVATTSTHSQTHPYQGSILTRPMASPHASSDSDKEGSG